jgi:AAA domain-containing protein
MQISQIGIYSAFGELRTLDFQTGALNIITGESESGKSAIIEIVRFCLGDEEFRVPVGVIQDKVAWYAIRLRLADGREALVARPRPPAGQKSATAALLRLGSAVPFPPFGDLSTNTTATAVVRSLGNAIGIDENQAPLNETASRRAVEATLDHALFFCIQRQDEIASRELLFHRQGEEYVAGAIPTSSGRSRRTISSY